MRHPVSSELQRARTTCGCRPESVWELGPGARALCQMWTQPTAKSWTYWMCPHPVCASRWPCLWLPALVCCNTLAVPMPHKWWALTAGRPDRPLGLHGPAQALFWDLPFWIAWCQTCSLPRAVRTRPWCKTAEISSNILRGYAVIAIINVFVKDGWEMLLAFTHCMFIRDPCALECVLM